MSYMLNAKCIEVEASECNQVSVDDIKISNVDSIVLHGRITDCEGEGIQGIAVKAFVADCNGDESSELIGISHTFSGCKGLYILTIPAEYNGQKIIVAAAGTSCNTPEQCEGENCNIEDCLCPVEPEQPETP